MQICFCIAVNYPPCVCDVINGACVSQKMFLFEMAIIKQQKNNTKMNEYNDLVCLTMFYWVCWV